MTERTMTGVEMIEAERERQISSEGWTFEHDDDHAEGELALAAQCYVMESVQPGEGYALWPWESRWWKPSNDPIRNLVKAGALIAAEIDRVQRRDR